MAERLPGVDLRTLPRPADRYPWAEWMDGSCWLLDARHRLRGTDLEHFRRTVHATAKRHGKRAITRTDGERTLIQFVADTDQVQVHDGDKSGH